MTGSLLRRFTRNPGRVLSLFVREVLLTGETLVGLLAAAVGLAALVSSAGALVAGSLASAAILGLVGATAAYGAGQSFLGRPLRGAGVVLVGLLVVGGGAHALDVGPADQSTGTPTVESGDADAGDGWSERDHTVHVGADGLNAYEDEGGPGNVGLSSRSESDLGH